MFFQQKLIIILLSIWFIVEVVGDEEDPNLIVELEHGKLRGRDNGYYYSYESIPYAEPPIGDLRFEAPQPYSGIWLDIFNAAQEPVPCMQWNEFIAGHNKLVGVEDCLTVNIYKPKNLTRSSFPVVVNIHGGAFMFAAARDNGHENFMYSGNVIVVKISYRLGPLGFLSGEDKDLPGNYGLKDQRLALHWIKTNIARFGGDAEDILLLGFSAGGASVHLQMLQPELKNIAKVAASFSGTALNPWVIGHKSSKRAFKMGKILRCGHVVDALELKNCLKSRSAEHIVAAVRHFLVFGYVPFTTFGPVIEPADAPEAFLTQHPSTIIRSGNFSQIPWLVSYTMQDGAYNAAMLLERQPRNQREIIEDLNYRWRDLMPYLLFYRDTMPSVEAMDDYSVSLKRRYLQGEAFSLDTYPAVEQMFTDVIFKNGAEQAVDLHRQHGSSPVYAYVYDNPSDRGIGQAMSKRHDITFGTVHGDDFFLIFPNTVINQERRSDEQIISKKFIAMLEDFVQNDAGSLAFDDCQFVNNVDRKKYQLMSITKKDCQNKKLTRFP